MRINRNIIYAKQIGWLIIAAIASLHSLAAGQEPRRTKAVAVDNLGDPLPEHAVFRFGTTRFRHPSTVVELALSPDNKTAITAGPTDMMAWDTETGKLRWKGSTEDGSFQLPGAAYGIRAVVFGPSSDYFNSASPPNSFLKWSTLTGEVESFPVSHSLPLLPSNRPLYGLPGSSRSVDMTTDGQKLALAGAHGLVVCDAAGKVLFEISNSPVEEIQPNFARDRLLFGGHYSMAIFSPDDHYLALVTSDSPSLIQLLDSNSGEVVRKIKLHARLVRMDFSPDSSKLVTTERDSAVRQYNVATGERTWEHVMKIENTAESYTSGVSFSPDGTLIAACAPIGSDHWIYVLSSSEGHVVAILKGHAGKPASVAFSSNGQLLYSAGWDGAIRRWDLKTFKQLDPPQGVRGSEVIASTPDLPWIAFADDLSTVHVVNSQTWQEQLKISSAELRYSQLAFSADGKLLAGGGASENEVHVVVWDWMTGSELNRWHWPKGDDPHSSVESLAFSADSQRLAAAVFRQDKAYLWDLSSGEQVAELTHPQIYGLSISPDSQELATAGWDEKIRIWNCNDGTLQRQLDLVEIRKDGNDLRMYGVKYSPRGESLATAHMDGTLRVWNRADLSLRNRLVLGGSFVYGAFDYSPDGMWLATGASNGEIKIWDPRTGKAMWDYGRHQSHVYTLSFVDQGRSLVSGGDDGVAYAWNLKSTDVIESDIAQLWRDLGASDEQTINRSMWEMLKIGEPSVAYLDEKLNYLRTVIDLEAIGSGLGAAEVDRRRRLALKLVERDSRVEIATRVRRALNLLGTLNTESSRSLLQEIAKDHPVQKLREAAAAELQNSEVAAPRQ